ncbi:MAG: hypothetical protein K6T65_06285 [Peptococcaceae bacterium]|nr:hypothetical protein [Peptococcaceae bacterium]
MAEEGARHANLEETLFHLLSSGGGREMDQGNLLVLLSLVNLMGIINIINFRLGIKQGAGADSGAGRPEVARPGSGPETGPETGPRGKVPPFDPASLLAMLGGKDRTGINPGQLADLFSRFMTPPSGKPPENEVSSTDPPSDVQKNRD